MKITLGAFFAQLRKEKGLTQKQLAEMLSVSDKTVSHWEREESSPDISLLPLIADIFEITVDELLKGERKEKSPKKKEEPAVKKTGLVYGLEIAFNKFRTKNLISLALTLIAVFCGMIVDYYETVTVGYLVFLAIMIITVSLTAFFRSSFSSSLMSPYIEKEQLNFFFHKSNRITVNSIYFSLFCFICYSCRCILCYTASVELVFIIFVAATTLVILCENFMRKKNFVSANKALTVKKVTVLKVVSVFICAILLFTTYVSHISISEGTLLYNKAESTRLSAEEFIECIQTVKDAPDEIYNNYNGYITSDFTPADKGMEVSFYIEFNEDNTAIQVLDPDYDGMITFVYNNLEIAEYSYSDGEFVVYTHSQLLAAEEEAQQAMRNLSALHFCLYPAVIGLSLLMYYIIKKRLDKSEKSDEITLIKNF